MKMKFKQWWATISTNINPMNSHLPSQLIEATASQLIEATAYGVENPSYGLAQAQKCVGVKPVNESQVLLLIIWFPLITRIIVLFYS